MFILLIGNDARSGDYHVGSADSIKVVRVDFVRPGIEFLTFPRDLYVDISKLGAGITRTKLSRAYLYGNPRLGYYQGTGQGPGLLTATLEQNFGAHIEHYVAVNLQTFARVVDTLGGIDINLPYQIDGRAGASSDPNHVFEAGQQHLDGYRTMLLARLHPNGDTQQSEVQNLILRALAARILAPDSLPQAPRLIEAFYSSVQTDLGAEDISRLLCLGFMLSPEDIRPVDFPSELFAPGNVQDPVLGYTFVWDVDFKALRPYVDGFNKGSWPATPTVVP